jgi:hypothetical protein
VSLLVVVSQAAQQVTQAPDLMQRLGDFLQGLSGLGVVAIVGILWRMSERIKGIEVVLNHEKIGLVSSVSLVRERYHEIAGKTQENAGRIDGHTHDISRIEGDIEQLQLGRIVRQSREPEVRS